MTLKYDPNIKVKIKDVHKAFISYVSTHNMSESKMSFVDEVWKYVREELMQDAHFFVILNCGSCKHQYFNQDGECSCDIYDDKSHIYNEICPDYEL